MYLHQVSECVVTVPYYLTEHERRIIIDAAAMVDLSVIMLVNDNTAVSIRSTPPPTPPHSNPTYPSPQDD